MDIGQINDLNQLKALAYDQLKELERVQNNVRTINERIAQVEQQAQLLANAEAAKARETAAPKEDGAPASDAEVGSPDHA